MVSRGRKRSRISTSGSIGIVAALAMLISSSLDVHAQTSQWTIADPGAGGAFITTQVGPTGVV